MRGAGADGPKKSYQNKKKSQRKRTHEDESCREIATARVRDYSLAGGRSSLSGFFSVSSLNN